MSDRIDLGDGLSLVFGEGTLVSEDGEVVNSDDYCARCGHWRKDHANKGYGGDSDWCCHVADGPPPYFAPREGEACECDAFERWWTHHNRIAPPGLAGLLALIAWLLDRACPCERGERVETEFRHFDPVAREADIHCRRCGRYLRMWNP